MQRFAPPALRGFEALRWYIHFFRDTFGCLTEARERFGPICTFENPIPGHQKGQRYVLSVGGALNREVLGRPGDFRPSGLVLDGPPGSALRRIRRGIFQMNGDIHRLHRRIMQPMFSKAAVASTVPAMAPLIDEILDRWQVGRQVDMLWEMRTLSNWVAAKVLFGSEDFSASLKVGTLIDRLATLDMHRRRWGFVQLDLPGTPYRRMLKHAETLEAAILEMIAEKRRADCEGADVLSFLIKTADSGAGMSDADVVAHAVALYGASFETTASALAWTMFLLAQHPAASARLRDEIAEELPGWPPDPQKLAAAPFLEAVVTESMRLLPPVPVTLRRVTGHVEFEGVQAEPGDKIILSQFLTHRDPQAYPEPGRFDPTRWLAARPDSYDYIPFSMGPRLCLGAFLATIEIKLAIVRIMQRYRVTMAPARIDAVLDFVLKPRGGLPMIVHEPEGAFIRVPVSGNINELIDLASPEGPIAPAGPGDAARCPYHAADGDKGAGTVLTTGLGALN